MRKALILAALLAAPAWADDDMPKFPKIAPPDPLPDAACAGVANPESWALGDWISPTLRVHVDQKTWSITGSASSTGAIVQLEACGLSLSADDAQIFAGVRAEDGGLYGAYWPAQGKVQRLVFHRP